MTIVRSWLCCLTALLLGIHPVHGAAANAAGPAPEVTLHGKSFYENGQPWIAKGVVIEGFNAPQSARKGAAKAAAYYGAKELAAAREVFGANTIHFKISQPGLDPKSSIFDPAYITELKTAVELARHSGFVVILSMDSQDENGVHGLPCMPTDATLRAWGSIVSWIRSDQGIMLEVFNEPCKPNNPQSEAEWVRVMQELVQGLRGMKSSNILLLNGLVYGRYVSGLFAKVHDSIPDHLALSVHPYLMKGFATRQDWDHYFGTSAQQYPIIATEFKATAKNGCVGADTPQLTLQMVRYLQERHIGLVVWAIDSSFGHLVRDHEKFEPLGYELFKGCGDGSVAGAGKLLVKFPNN